MGNKDGSQIVAIKFACSRVGTGLCKACGTECPESAANHVLCKVCRLEYYRTYQPRIRAYNKERARRIVDSGRCPNHVEVELPEGQSKCEVCKKKSNQIDRDRRARLVADGVCTKCRKVPAENGKTTCLICCKVLAEKTRMRRARKKAP